MSVGFRSLAGAAVAAAVVVTMAGCGEATDGGKGASKTVRIGWEKTTADAALYHMKDLAAKYGVKVELKEFARHPDIKTAMVNGSIDFGSVTAPDLAFALDSGSKAVTALAGEGRGGDYLQCRKGVNPQSWEDLSVRKYRFKTFAGGIAWLKLMASLHENGIDAEKVGLEKIAGGPPDMALLIKTKEADIGTNVDPFVAQGKINGDSDYCNLDINASKIGSLNALFSAKSSLVKSDPELVEKVLDMYLASVKDLQGDTDLWAKVYESYSGLPADVATQAIAHVKLDVIIPEEEIVTAAAFMLDQGLITRDIETEVRSSLAFDILAKATGKSAEELGKSSS